MAQLLAGFADAISDSQRTFRAVLDAMAHPLREVGITPPQECPAGMSGPSAAILLTLCDYTTPVWLPDDVADDGEIAAYLRFHAGAPVTRQRGDAAFAWMPAILSDLSGFSVGTQEYPDRSTTLILDGVEIGVGMEIEGTGPGIDGSVSQQVDGVSAKFWASVIENNRQYPLGVDLIFSGTASIFSLPRSTRIEV